MASESELVPQALLRSGDSELVIWLRTNKKIKVGNVITLKNSLDPDRKWTVKELYAPRPYDQLHTDWKVGGLTR